MAKPRAARSRRGVSLLATLLMVVVFVGALSVVVQGRVRETQFRLADEMANVITHHAGALDFWVHTNKAALLSSTTDGTAAYLNGAQINGVKDAPTTPPFVNTSIKNWTIEYLVARPFGEALPFGVLTAVPSTSSTRALSPLVQSKLAERIGASQLGGGGDLIDARALLIASSITNLDGNAVVLYTYPLNGLNTDYVRRGAFAGYKAPFVDAETSLGGHNITQALSVEVRDALIETVDVPDPAIVLAQDLTMNSAAITDVNVSGSASLAHVISQNLTADELVLNDGASVGVLRALGKTEIDQAVITSSLASNLVYAQNNIQADAFTTNHGEISHMSVTGLATMDEGHAARFAMQHLDVTFLNVLTGCQGC